MQIKRKKMANLTNKKLYKYKAMIRQIKIIASPESVACFLDIENIQKTFLFVLCIIDRNKYDDNVQNPYRKYSVKSKYTNKKFKAMKNSGLPCVCLSQFITHNDEYKIPFEKQGFDLQYFLLYSLYVSFILLHHLNEDNFIIHHFIC